jgi:hypothetical protein
LRILISPNLIKDRSEFIVLSDILTYCKRYANRTQKPQTSGNESLTCLSSPLSGARMRGICKRDLQIQFLNNGLNAGGSSKV